MKRILTVMVVAAGLILLPLVTPRVGPLGHASVVSAASGPSISGEVFQQQTGNFQMTDGTACGQQPFTIDFTATGTAKGTINGTYTETGKLTFGNDPVTGAAVITSASGQFTVTNSGSTVGSGSVTGIDPNAMDPEGTTPFGYCTFPSANVDVYLDYTVTNNVYTWVSAAEMTVTPVNGSATTENFQQTFLTSTTTDCFTSIDMPFNGTAIAGNNTIWMTATLQVTKGPSTPAGATINFTGQTVNIPGIGATPVPDGHVTFSSTATAPSTSYSGGSWATTVPASYSGKTFWVGIPVQVPSTGLPGSVKPVTWSGSINSATPGLTVHWQWQAAVYTNTTQFSTDYAANNLAVAPEDGLGTGDAGTPVNEIKYVTGGARGGGGSNYTGSLSAVAACST